MRRGRPKGLAPPKTAAARKALQRERGRAAGADHPDRIKVEGRQADFEIWVSAVSRLPDGQKVITEGYRLVGRAVGGSSSLAVRQLVESGGGAIPLADPDTGKFARTAEGKRFIWRKLGYQARAETASRNLGYLHRNADSLNRLLQGSGRWGAYGAGSLEGPEATKYDPISEKELAVSRRATDALATRERLRDMGSLRAAAEHAGQIGRERAVQIGGRYPSEWEEAQRDLAPQLAPEEFSEALRNGRIPYENCPQCGNQLSVDEQEAMLICEVCGGRWAIYVEQEEPADAAQEKPYLSESLSVIKKRLFRRGPRRSNPPPPKITGIGRAPREGREPRPATKLRKLKAAEKPSSDTA